MSTLTTKITLETLEEILTPGQQGRAGELNRSILVEYLCTESPTHDSPYTTHIFRDFGDNRVSVCLDKTTREITVYWMNAGPNFSMKCVAWKYTLDRPQGFHDPVMSYEAF